MRSFLALRSFLGAKGLALEARSSLSTAFLLVFPLLIAHSDIVVTLLLLRGYVRSDIAFSFVPRNVGVSSKGLTSMNEVGECRVGVIAGGVMIEGETYQSFLLFNFSCSCRLTAFFNLPTSSFTFSPPMRISAFDH